MGTFRSSLYVRQLVTVFVFECNMACTNAVLYVCAKSLTIFIGMLICMCAYSLYLAALDAAQYVVLRRCENGRQFVLIKPKVQREGKHNHNIIHIPYENNI